MYSNSQQSSNKNEYLVTTSDYLLDINRPGNKKTTIFIYRGKDNIETLNTLNNKKIIQVSSGLDHTLFLTSDRCVFSYGTGSFGQLGQGKSIQKLKEPKQIEELKEIQKISCGTYSSLALNKNGDVYRWGLYDARSTPIFTPKLEIFFKETNSKVVEIVSCKEKTCLALDTGEIYIWDFHNPRITLICKLNDSYAKQISIGAHFGLLLDCKSQLFVWGDNTFGEFGDHDLLIYNNNFPNFYQVNIESWGLSSKNNINGNKNENYNLIIEDSKDIYIDSISSGEKHSLILTSNNTILCMGDNTYGQCGIVDDKSTIYPPITLKKFNNLDFYKPYISCGNKSSAIISPNGKLFLCGEILEETDTNKKPGLSKYADEQQNLNRLSVEYSIIHKNSIIIEFSENNFIVVSN